MPRAFKVLTVMAAEDERPIPSGRRLLILKDSFLITIEYFFPKNKHEPIIKSAQSPLFSNFSIDNVF